MPDIELTRAERTTLREMARKTGDVRVLRRAQVLLDLDAGESATVVAARYCVGRSTVYDWVKRYQEERAGEPLAQRLQDRARTGRPPTKRQAAEQMIAGVISASPQEHGYRHTVWTVPLLRQHLARTQAIEVSGRTIQRALHDLGYRYKRPRHRLARRPKYWRQAKGG